MGTPGRYQDMRLQNMGGLGFLLVRESLQKHLEKTEIVIGVCSKFSYIYRSYSLRTPSA